MSSLTPNAAIKKTASERRVEAFSAIVFTYLVLVAFTFFNSSPHFFVLIGSGSVRVETAVTAAERQKGLGGRNFLEHGKGMLFLYDKTGQRYIWMKDMRFSIDIVWLDVNKKVVQVNRNIAPSTYPEVFTANNYNVKYILELPAGDAARYGIAPEQTVTFYMR